LNAIAQKSLYYLIIAVNLPVVVIRFCAQLV
jgi:hypothetical protein